MRIRFFIIIFFLFSPQLLAQELIIQDIQDDFYRKSSITLYLENDLISGSDSDYTHGTKVSYERAVSGTFFDFLLPAPGNREKFSFFQFIYTPKDLEVVELQPNDRPWAGWASFEYLASFETKKEYFASGIQAGVVGPYAFSDVVQKNVHRWTDNIIPLGWDNQIEHHYAVNYIHYYKNKIVSEKTYDIIAGGLMSAGSSHNLVGVTSMVRIGNNIPLNFGSGSVEPLNIKKDIEIDEKHIYLIFGYNARYVFYNSTLERQSNYDIEINRVVQEFYSGFGFDYKAFSLTYKYVVRSKEYRQEEDWKPFGTISISYVF